ncbi:MAG: efflux RND transporter periplasmic adaptor subunit [Bacteroidota bacterium]
MNKGLRNGLILLAVLVAVVLLTSPRVRQLITGMDQDQSVSDGDRRLPVSGFVVRPSVVKNAVTSTGTVIANEAVELRSEITGTVEKIHFKEGTRVNKDDLLVKINDDELQAQLFTLDSELKLAQDREQRRKQLYDKKTISPEDYETALNELNAIKGEVQLITAKISKTEIRAPFRGIVGLRFVSQGSYVSPLTRIASLQDTKSIKVDFSVPGRYATSVHQGQTIRFRISGLEETFEGTIFAVEPKIDPSTRMVLLRARSRNESGRIMPGAFAEIELVLEELEDALMIPTEALIPDLKGQTVFVCSEGVALERRVETGLRTENRIQVTAGLQPLDTVITTGILQIVSGMPVVLSEVTEP